MDFDFPHQLYKISVTLCDFVYILQEVNLNYIFVIIQDNILQILSKKINTKHFNFENNETIKLSSFWICIFSFAIIFLRLLNIAILELGTSYKQKHKKTYCYCNFS